jgi:hypothetical protein
MSIVQKLTEGMVQRDLRKESHALVQKWEKTGLLEGISDDRNKHTMARLLENQAKELLRESSTMAAGDVEGFAAVAFPIVRRVFAGLIANDLVSVQPMSLPSGLIFFLDFNIASTAGSGPRLGYDANDSVYGQGVLGQQITGGVNLTGVNAEKGFYGLNNGYTSPTGSAAVAQTIVASGTFGAGATANTNGDAYLDSWARYDADFTSGTTKLAVFSAPLTTFTAQQFNLKDLVSISFSSSVGLNVTGTAGRTRLVRRLSKLGDGTTLGAGATSVGNVYLTYASDTATLAQVVSDASSSATTTMTFAMTDDFTGTPAAGSTNALGAVVGTDSWGLEGNSSIPEIDIKVESISVTAITKKMKAKWSPELGQDLNAYHNLDAEVELTSILSEQVGLEIDREILEDLVKGATAGTFYWSRSPGLFVNKLTGIEVGSSAKAPDFTGNVSMWYETLIETLNDVSAQIHRKTLRGGANFIVCNPEVASILEMTAGFRARIGVDDEKGEVGVVNVGSISKKWDVYVDPYFLRNVILIGRKGSSFLESGYVYAPYVPLQVTPTIFGIEDFVPRKGVMTRYAKKMIRPDFYGLVVIRGMFGESGA